MPSLTQLRTLNGPIKPIDLCAMDLLGKVSKKKNGQSMVFCQPTLDPPPMYGPLILIFSDFPDFFGFLDFFSRKKKLK